MFSHKHPDPVLARAQDGIGRKLLVFTEITDVCLDQLFCPVGNRLKLTCEETESLGLVNEAQTANHFSVVVDSAAVYTAERTIWIDFLISGF